MCRYGNRSYKGHFVCFACHKAFKKPMIEEYLRSANLDKTYNKLAKFAFNGSALKIEESSLGVTLEQLREQYFSDVSVCSHCGGRMVEMGYDFKAPRMRDEEAWRIIQVLYEAGFAFKGCGCDVGYSAPDKMSELREFFAKHGRPSEGEALLYKISALRPERKR